METRNFVNNWAKAMIVSGALAGLGGVNYVLGYKHYYEEGFAAGSGFLGIAVALVGRNHPVGVVIAALLFATLSQGGLAVNALVPKQMVDVLTAVVIIAVATSVPEVKRALAAARRRPRSGISEPGTEATSEQPIVNPGPSSQFPVQGLSRATTRDLPQ